MKALLLALLLSGCATAPIDRVWVIKTERDGFWMRREWGEPIATQLYWCRRADGAPVCVKAPFAAFEEPAAIPQRRPRIGILPPSWSK
jgi:hypothetical protein